MTNCIEMETLLNDRLDRLLDAAGEARVQAHLATCVRCRAAWDQLVDLRQRTRALPRAVEPPPGVWAGVAAGLAPAWGRPRAWALAATVALVSVLVAVTWRPDGVSAPEPAASASPEAALAAFQAAEAQYRQAGQQLLAALETAGPGLPPATREVIENNLALIDASIREVRTALERHPEQPEHGYRLVQLHRRKLDLLEQTTRILRGQAGSPTKNEEST